MERGPWGTGQPRAARMNSAKERRWQRAALISAIVTIAAVAACADQEPIGPRGRTITPLTSVTGGACFLQPRPHAPTGAYYSFLDPDTVTICGVRFTINALDSIGPDSAITWWYQLQNDTSWLTSGTWLGPSGQPPLVVTTDKPIRNLRIVWQFSPEPNSRITLYNDGDSILAQRDVGSNPEPSPKGTSWTQETHSFTESAIRKIRLQKGPSGSNRMYVHVFFDPDTIFCPPYDDSLLDPAALRRALEDLLVDGNAWNPAHANRREVVIHYWRNPDGTVRAERPPQTNEVCQVSHSLPIADPNFLGKAHGHPFSAGELTPCDGKYDPSKTGGGSGWDFRQNFDNNIIRTGTYLLPPYRDIVIDKDSIWIFETPAIPFRAATHTRRVARVDLNCTRVF